MNIENLANATAARAAANIKKKTTGKTTLVRINRDVQAAVREVAVRRRVPMIDVLCLAALIGLNEAEARIVKQSAKNAVKETA